MALYEFFTSRNNAVANSAAYVGHTGRMFYDSTTREIRISDGDTLNGQPIVIPIATANVVGGIKPGAGFTIDTVGTLGLNAGPSFFLDESNVFRLRPGTADLIGGIKAGPGLVIDSEGTLFIDTSGLPFTFGDFTATVGEYTDETEYALLGSVNADQDVVIASNGTGTVCIVGELHVHKTNGTVTGSLEDGAVFEVLADGQIKAYITDLDDNAGALEIIGSTTGNIIAPGQPGTMLHLTGQVNQQCRFYMDGNGNYASIVGRRWNGNVAVPTQVLANEDVLRINATAATDAGVGNVALAQISLTALENQTTTAQGSKITFTVTPVGSAASARVNVANVTVADGVWATKFTTSGTISATGNIAGGNLTTTGITSTGSLTTPGTITATGNIAGGNLSVTGTATITGNASAGNLSATNYTGKVTHSIRNAGSVGGTTLTLNVTTDDIVKCTFTSDFTVAFSSITPGRVITLIATNTSAGDSDVITDGIAGLNAQSGATYTVSQQSTAVITYYSLDGDTANIYAAAVYQ